MKHKLNHIVARKLRKSMTDTEKHLWYVLRFKNIDGLKFRRQQPIGKYIVDFVSFEKSLIIEIDGGQHAAAASKDLARDKWLKAQGFTVLRFWNNEVLKNREAVIEQIIKHCRR